MTEPMEVPSPAPFRWRGLVAQGTTIVVSILLAFAIDAWWDGVQEEEVERQLLSAIERDLIASLEDLELVDSLSTSYVEHYETFYESEPSELALLAPDSAELVFRSLFSVKTYQPYDGALRLADLTIIGDEDLRSQLGRWIGLSEDLMENSPVLFARMLDVWETGGLSAWEVRVWEMDPSYQQTLAELRTNEAFLRAAGIFVEIKLNTHGKALRLIDVTEDLIARLDRAN